MNFFDSLEKFATSSEVITVTAILGGLGGAYLGFLVGGVGGAIVGAVLGAGVGFILPTALLQAAGVGIVILVMAAAIGAVVFVIWAIYSLWGVGK